MAEEFDLSKKINDYGYNDDGTPDSDILEVDDVKEFIRQLKENVTELGFSDVVDKHTLFEIINKLAGDRLK